MNYFFLVALDITYKPQLNRALLYTHNYPAHSKSFLKFYFGAGGA